MAPSTPGSSPRLTAAPAPPSPLSPRSHRNPPSGSPVFCPFCNKELPASLVCGSRTEAHQQSPTTLGAGDSNPAPVVPTAALMSSEGDGDRTDNLASKAAISEEDIRRWSFLAGVTVSEPVPRAAPAQPPAKEESKPVPLLPPPPGARASPKPTPGRFGGLFSSKKGRSEARDDDSDDESDGIISGYAKLGAPGSDDDGDDDYESDKEIKFKPRPREERPPTPATDRGDRPETPGLAAPIALKASSEAGADAGDAELRSVLREVLSRVAALSQSHAELQSSHTTLLTSLKIARSNLVMAEANTEMLEAELKRAKSTAAVAARARPAPARSSASIDVAPIDTRASASSGKQGWFGRSKASSPTEATTRMSGETTSPTDSDELRRLRSQVEAQNTELEALKKGKKEIESELEGLSQALFEEANKMVADERRKRAELEETLQEVKGERQALRETVKVLGGRIQTPPPIPTPHEAVDESPNLDQHYAALRRSIHHVVDGPTPGVSEPGTPPEEDEAGETPTAEREEEASDGSEGAGPKESPELRLPGGFATPSFDSEPNPWAASSVAV